MKTKDTICNISSTKLSESKISLLNKGLNFCPPTKEPKKKQLLDDTNRKLKLKEYFYAGDNITNKHCYFNPNHGTPLNLQRYISVVKKEVTELLKKPHYQEQRPTIDIS